ncbi:ABC transporter ATP-binding protein [Agrobacterium sp. BT-220-3]|nr:ABC transporter ATP-binding protein [Agrobacterium sp. BT-220-3]
MSSITLSKIRKSFGALEIIKGVDISIKQGEFAVFVGPSGCGKSTLLRMIAGLESISGGEFRLDGELMNDVSPDKRGLAMVFQSYALYPHMTVAENIGFSLDLKGVDKADIKRKVGAVAEKLQLSALLDRKPQALSGGQRQRVAIGRAIIKEPKVILFDEPLSNLDAALRVQMRAELQELHRTTGSTIIYVTHDQVEAMTLADRIVVLKDGEVQQADHPIALYKEPDNLFVAQFIGSPRMNVFPAHVEAVNDAIATILTVDGWRVRLEGFKDLVPGRAVQLGLRPEDLSLADPLDADFTAETLLSERLGMETYISFKTDGTPAIARIVGDHRIGTGEPVPLKINHLACHLFDQSGRAIQRVQNH